MTAVVRVVWRSQYTLYDGRRTLTFKSKNGCHIVVNI